MNPVVYLLQDKGKTSVLSDQGADGSHQHGDDRNIVHSGNSASDGSKDFGWGQGTGQQTDDDGKYSAADQYDKYIDSD